MKPGDYPLGSNQSRAAARHALRARGAAAQFKGILVLFVSPGSMPQSDQGCTCWTPLAELHSAGVSFEASIRQDERNSVLVFGS
jgi:hypothetical protein